MSDIPDQAIVIPNDVGRPSKYKPEYCQMVINWGKQGKSKAWMCGTLEVTRQTFENWAKEYPEFLDAMDIAMTTSQVWWEDTGQLGEGRAGGAL